MAGDLASPDAPAPVLDGAGLRISVVCARFNSRITLRLLDGARRGLAAAGVRRGDIVVHWVPGAFELPLAAKALAESGTVDAVITLGCVIRGETTHYELVTEQCAAGVQAAQLDTGVPILFGVATTESRHQAYARSQDAGGHNLGEDCADGAVEMATLLHTLRPAR